MAVAGCEENELSSRLAQGCERHDTASQLTRPMLPLSTSQPEDAQEGSPALCRAMALPHQAHLHKGARVVGRQQGRLDLLPHRVDEILLMQERYLRMDVGTRIFEVFVGRARKCPAGDEISLPVTHSATELDLGTQHTPPSWWGGH